LCRERVRCRWRWSWRRRRNNGVRWWWFGGEQPKRKKKPNEKKKLEAIISNQLPVVRTWTLTMTIQTYSLDESPKRVSESVDLEGGRRSTVLRGH
jgi:hypothetical protein